MRILWLSWKSILHPDAGGAEQYGHQMAKALASQDHLVTWISLSPDKWRSPFLSLRSNSTTTHDNISYGFLGHRLLMYTGLFHLFVFLNYLLYWRHQFDLIIDEIHGPPLLIPLYARKPILVVIHEVAGEIWHKTIPSPLSHFMQKFLEPLFFQAYKNQTIVTVSQSTQSDLTKLGIPTKNIQVIHNGFDTPNLHKQFPKETNPTLIFLSEIRPIKGLDRVHEAYTEIQKSLPNVQLWIVGNDQTPYAQELKQKVFTDQSITFFGKVSENYKYELLARAHILVHGSYKEGWGRVVLEANSVGTPTIVYDADGLREAVRHNQTGFVAYSQAEFSDYVYKLLHDTELYQKFSASAKSWSAQFTWEKSTQQFYSIIPIQ
jgi:glycosyltransferase involved in cell wall biosynthesis